MEIACEKPELWRLPVKNLNQIPDCELLLIVKAKADAERNLTLDVIDLFREIQSRRLHLKRGFSSLHEFCVRELKYSDGAAFRRIKAMKLVEDIPEVIQSLQTGSLNLSTASQLQSAFETKAKDQKPMTREEKIELVSLVQNQSRREAERMIAKVCPETVRIQEKVRAINEFQVKVELVIGSQLYQKIEKLKALTSHKNKSLIELFENLVDQELKRKDPKLKTLKSVASMEQELSCKNLKLRTSKSLTASPERVWKVALLILKIGASAPNPVSSGLPGRPIVNKCFSAEQLSTKN